MGDRCGGGTQMRSRECSIPSIVSSGESLCPSGPSEDFQNCNEHACERWSEWGAWGACDATCGSSLRNRARTCIDGMPGDPNCQGSTSDVEQCNLNDCPRWSLWSDFSTCSESCGQGFQSRTRSCVNTPVQGDTSYCGEGATMETVPCAIKEKCEGWSIWGDFSVCSVSCGGGTTTRERYCVDGDIGDIGCQGVRTEQKSCNDQVTVEHFIEN